MGSSAKYFEKVKPTYIENWPASLDRLSIAQKGLPLTEDQAKSMSRCNGDWGAASDKDFQESLEVVSAVRRHVADMVEDFPFGTVIRLGSRSPKDSWAWHRQSGKTTSGDDPLAYLLDSSERVYEDLCLASMNNYLPWIWVRQWVNFQPWQEVRCFQRNGQIVGMSQYNYRKPSEEIREHASGFEWAIRQFHPTFAAACHLRDVVFDVIVKVQELIPDDGVKTCRYEVVLMEINPFFEMTDPCLFSWKKDDFDGSFRVTGGTPESKDDEEK